VRGQRASALPGREVRYRDIRLGVVVDVLFALDVRSVLGFAVRCGDDRIRFLPVRACELGHNHVSVGSPFLLIEDGFYRSHGRLLSALRGTQVREAGKLIGDIVDVVVQDDAIPTALCVQTRNGERELSLEQGVVVESRPLRPAV
jgi:hypothetical protein